MRPRSARFPWLCAVLSIAGIPSAGAPRDAAGESAAQQPSTASDAGFADRLRSTRAAVERCDWERLLQQAGEISAAAARGSDAWIEASAWQGLAAWRLGDHARLEEIARDVAAAITERRRGDPRPASLFSVLDPITAIPALHLEVSAAALLQSRARHGEALDRLRGARAHLSASPHPRAQELLRDVEISMAPSLLALGRAEEARDLLRALRDRSPRTRAGAMACAILQANGAHPEEYRGKYAGDPGHRRRMEGLWRLVPAAKKRLAAAIGWSESDLPTPWIGVADTNPDSPGLGAVTEGDPARPDLPCVIVVHSEPLAIGIDEPETLLVHELAHAVMTQTLGLRYRAMPVWMREGLAQAASGELDDLAELLVRHALDEDADRFFRREFWQLAPLVFDAEPCDDLGPPAGALLALELCAAREGQGLVHLGRALHAGKSWPAALAEATGLSVDEYLARAQERARHAVEEKREESINGLRLLHRAAQRSVEEALASAEDALAREVPRLVRGRALALRASALERLQRRPEALAAWNELLAPGTALTGYVEMARMGTARCLLALGRRAEAERCLTDLARDALQPTARDWAVARLRELRSSK